MSEDATPKPPLFVRHVAVEEQTNEEDGTLMGDRITVRMLPEDGFRAARVALHREDKMVHGSASERGYDWDWKVDPDQGLCMSIEHAKELHDALSEALGFPTAGDRRNAQAYFTRIDDGTKRMLAEQSVMLARALKECATDWFHLDLCGVCHHHIVDCNETTVMDDFPDGNARLACAGARARLLLGNLPEELR